VRCEVYLDILHPSVMDRQTDRLAHSICCATLLRAKIKITGYTLYITCFQ